MPEETRVFTIPLRDVKRVPRTKRAPKAIKIIRAYMKRHMKMKDDDKLLIDAQVNEAIWARGIQSPPSKIRVRAIRWEEDATVEVTLPEDTFASTD